MTGERIICMKMGLKKGGKYCDLYFKYKKGWEEEVGKVLYQLGKKQSEFEERMNTLTEDAGAGPVPSQMVEN